MRLRLLKTAVPAVLLACATVSTADAQLYDMGGPHDWNESPGIIPAHKMPGFDLDQALLEDEINNENKVGLWRFGFEYDTNIDVVKEGLQYDLENGDRIYLMKLRAPNALSINIIFDKFELPRGAYVYVYDELGETMDGAYTWENNNEARMLGTNPVKGETMIVEYYEPKNVVGEGNLNIGMVVHGYRDVEGFWGVEKVNESGACNMDVICDDGDPWRQQIRSVARIVVGGGFCTGALVNNTANDFTPYFLTANHCGPQNMAGAIFRFNYDSPICGSQLVANSQAGPFNNQVNGSMFRARSSQSDFGLVELNTIPPASYNVFYAGWESNGAVPQASVGIHHPSGDVKKLAFDENPAGSGAILGAAPNAEWRIFNWERNTTTEGGSSGSPLFDANSKRIVGQLHGGQAFCANSVNDYYGKFSESWDRSPLNANQLEHWLDPGNSGVSGIDGIDPNSPDGIEEVDLGSFSVYPNPSAGNVSIDLSALKIEGALTLNVVDVTGRLMLSQGINQSNGQQFEVDLSGLSNGLYFVEVASNTAKLAQKIQVQK